MYIPQSVPNLNTECSLSNATRGASTAPTKIVVRVVQPCLLPTTWMVTRRCAASGAAARRGARATKSCSTISAPRTAKPARIRNALGPGATARSESLPPSTSSVRLRHVAVCKPLNMALVVGHTDWQPFVCTEDGCEQRFKHRVSLVRHVAAHGVPSIQPFPEQHEASVSCGWSGCAQVFDDPAELLAHLRAEHATSGGATCRWAGCAKQLSEGGPVRQNMFAHLRCTSVLRGVVWVMLDRD